MNTRVIPRQLAIDLCRRSPCRTKMAAVLFDAWGIFSWGWNFSGPHGLGMHAEDHCLHRANRRRLGGSRMVVAGLKPSGKGLVPSRPCEGCRTRLQASGVELVIFHEDGEWVERMVGNL